MSSSLVKPRRCVSGVDEASLFAYWLWSCVVTVLILLTKYWRPRDVTLLNYFLQPRSITSACWICTTDGRSISLAATIRPPTTPPYTPCTPKSHPPCRERGKGGCNMGARSNCMFGGQTEWGSTRLVAMVVRETWSQQPTIHLAIIQTCFSLSSRVLLVSNLRRSNWKCTVKRFFKSTVMSFVQRM